MKMITNIKKSVSDSFLIDKILFPSKMKRIISWIMAISIIPLTAIAIIINVERIGIILILFGVFLYFWSLSGWMNKATKYILDKERKTEV